jgi:transposase-like protein
LLSKEEPAVQIPRRVGVSEQTLYRWRDEFINGGKAQLGGRGVEARQGRKLEKRFLKHTLLILLSFSIPAFRRPEHPTLTYLPLITE